ncbi:hypothetical protein M0805_001724 [Coniferiporia weirii]|nr:hypothetical protein M0805_001724 [Coniferiporia weirii]
MAHSLPYPVPYMTAPHAQYLLAPHPQHPHVPGAVHLVSAQMRNEQPQRKRPKYTRSKTGCLTCRGKKIKCDETKPKCQRCAHGQRECTWPDPIPTKKKTPARKNSAGQKRPSSADSTSHVSDSSSTSRGLTPNGQGDLSGNVSAASIPDSGRRHSDAQAYSYDSTHNVVGRRQTGSLNQLPHAHPSSLNPISDLPPSYSTSMANSYSFSHSPNGSISSRSNSRPSTASSMPSSRFSGTGLEGNHYDNSPALSSLEGRDYPRWETLPPPRPESNPYGYHPSQENSIMARHYSHEGNRI